jgi:hypothetical protein
MEVPVIKRQEKNTQIDRNMYRIFEWNFSQTENEEWGGGGGEKRKQNPNRGFSR